MVWSRIFQVVLVQKSFELRGNPSPRSTWSWAVRFCCLWPCETAPRHWPASCWSCMWPAWSTISFCWLKFGTFLYSNLRDRLLPWSYIKGNGLRDFHIDNLSLLPLCNLFLGLICYEVWDDTHSLVVFPGHNLHFQQSTVRRGYCTALCFLHCLQVEVCFSNVWPNGTTSLYT